MNCFFLLLLQHMQLVIVLSCYFCNKHSVRNVTWKESRFFRGAKNSYDSVIIQMFECDANGVNPYGSSLLSPGPSSPTGPKSQCSSTPLGSSPTHSKHTFGDLPFGYREIALREFAVHASTIHMQNKTPIPDGQRVNSFRYREFLYREIGGCGVVRLMQHKTPNPETPMPRGFHYVSWSHTTTSLRDFADRESTTQSFLGVGNPECRYADALDSYHLSLLKSTALINSGNRHS
jgi:hypothetical protein